jgi:hypothetical protein
MASHKQSYELSKSADFVATVCAQIRHEQARVLRIHSSGDFYSRRYIRRWQTIARRNRRTDFYAYTRSWNSPELLDALLQFAAEPNVTLFFSTDRSMPEPPRYDNIRVAWLAVDDNDTPPYPVHLIFRHRAKTQMKRMDGYQVCPYEQKVERETPISCSRCKLCFADAKDKTWFERRLPILQQPAGRIRPVRRQSTIALFRKALVSPALHSTSVVLPASGCA